MTKLYTNREIRQIEKLSIAGNPEAEQELMRSAGLAAFEAMRTNWPDAKKIIICCGGGNNGGDGYVVAQLADQHGYEVHVYTMCHLDTLSGPAKLAAENCLGAGVALTDFHPDLGFTADVIVDALLGIGLKDEVRGGYVDCINAINAAEAPVLSIDVPSGLCADTGSILGCTVQAYLTVTFIGLKQGLFTGKGPGCAAVIECNDLGIKKEIFEQVEYSSNLMEWQNAKHYLPKRLKDTHKGDCGHVLVIGGDYGMGGAVRLAAEAAMRVGAGLVTVATRPEHVSVVSGSRPEIMCHQVLGKDDLIKLIEQVDVIAIGPGLGKTEWAQELLACVLEQDLPKVLDADALNLLSQDPMNDDSWVLTPHPGEASRLLDQGCQEVQNNRFNSAMALQKKYGGTIILKGAGTIVQSANKHPQICQAGNPGMASGGMGDILSGVIAGLLAQGLTQEQAAEVGVLVHSKAADQAAEQGGERGLLATDVINCIRELVNPK